MDDGLSDEDIPEPGRYGPPIDQLLTLGFNPTPPLPVEGYRALGIRPEQIPELIRMATGPSLSLAGSGSPEAWARLHAARALGQLRAAEAVRPLLRAAEHWPEDDYLTGELPIVFGQIGTAAIPALAACLASRAYPMLVRARASSGLQRIGNLYPESRDECVAVLVGQIKEAAINDPALNGFVISDLVALNAVEAGQAIKKAFEKGYIDEATVGSWEDLEAKLGLLRAQGSGLDGKEEVYYKCGVVLITSRGATFGGATYPLAFLNAPKMNTQRHLPDRQGLGCATEVAEVAGGVLVCIFLFVTGLDIPWYTKWLLALALVLIFFLVVGAQPLLDRLGAPLESEISLEIGGRRHTVVAAIDVQYAVEIVAALEKAIRSREYETRTRIFSDTDVTEEPPQEGGTPPTEGDSAPRQRRVK